MNIITEQITVQSHTKNEFIDITQTIKSMVKKHDIHEGQVQLFVPHTTSAVTINENADPDVTNDLIYGLNKTYPNDKQYTHFEGNTDAHFKSSVIGVDQTILITQGSLTLGTWQGIYFCEFDGPKTRKVIIRITGHQKDAIIKL